MNRGHQIDIDNPCKVIRGIAEEERNYWKEEYKKYISEQSDRS